MQTSSNDKFVIADHFRGIRELWSALRYAPFVQHAADGELERLGRGFMEHAPEQFTFLICGLIDFDRHTRLSTPMMAAVTKLIRIDVLRSLSLLRTRIEALIWLLEHDVVSHQDLNRAVMDFVQSLEDKPVSEQPASDVRISEENLPEATPADNIPVLEAPTIAPDQEPAPVEKPDPIPKPNISRGVLTISPIEGSTMVDLMFGNKSVTISRNTRSWEILEALAQHNGAMGYEQAKAIWKDGITESGMNKAARRITDSLKPLGLRARCGQGSGLRLATHSGSVPRLAYAIRK